MLKSVAFTAGALSYEADLAGFRELVCLIRLLCNQIMSSF
jgi:hypothetical protein